MTTTTTLPASIRNRNPGAMWPGSAATKFGSTATQQLTDAQRNKMAVFPTSVDGASAQFYLLRTSTKHYYGKTIAEAISTWSGGNDVNAYLRVIETRTRWTRTDFVTAEILDDPNEAIPFAKAMARHEAGIEYPMTDAQWAEAHEQYLTVLHGGKIALDKASPLPATAPLELAMTFIGEKRIPGSGTNPVIEDLFKEIGSTIRGDDESYCAAGVGAMLKRTGYAYVPAPQGQMARSYLNYGHALDEPEEGCIVVQWRNAPNSIWGHVEFVESWTATHLTVVGFNVGGAVVRRTIPRLKSNGGRVLGYRRPVPAVTPAREVLADDEIKRDTVGWVGTAISLYYLAKGWVGDFVSSIGEYIGLLPKAASDATDAVSTGQSLFNSAGVPWPLTLGLVIVLAAISFNLYERWKQKRVNTGELTRPPYETDEPLPEGQDGDFVDALGYRETVVDPTSNRGEPQEVETAGEAAVKLRGPIFSRDDVLELVRAINASLPDAHQIAIQEVRKAAKKPASKKRAPAKKTAPRRKAAA